MWILYGHFFGIQIRLLSVFIYTAIFFWGMLHTKWDSWHYKYISEVSYIDEVFLLAQHSWIHICTLVKITYPVVCIEMVCTDIRWQFVFDRRTNKPLNLRGKRGQLCSDGVIWHYVKSWRGRGGFGWKLHVVHSFSHKRGVVLASVGYVSRDYLNLNRWRGRRSALLGEHMLSICSSSQAGLIALSKCAYDARIRWKTVRVVGTETSSGTRAYNEFFTVYNWTT